VGTGSTGKLATRLLREAGVGRLSVASRNQERAAEVAAEVQGSPLRTSDVPAALADADILVTAGGAAAPVVLAGQVRAPGRRPAGRRCSCSTWACRPTSNPPSGRLARQDQAVAAPVIAAMHVQIRQLADAELARLRDRLPDLSEQQQAEMTATVYRILRKILHQPTVRAKEFSTGPNGPVYLDALRQLFDLRTGEAAT
jgi:glutamyl-tRNA reductase